MARKLKQNAFPTQDEIARYAYFMYAQERPGEALEYWRQAEAQLIACTADHGGVVAQNEYLDT